jgi:hypothetical protein
VPTATQTKTPQNAEEFLAYLSASDSTRARASALTDVVWLRRGCAALRAQRSAVGA